LICGTPIRVAMMRSRLIHALHPELVEGRILRYSGHACSDKLCVNGLGMDEMSCRLMGSRARAVLTGRRIASARLMGRRAPWPTWTVVLLCLGVLLLSVVDAGEPLGAWQAPLRQDHPLAGRIWDVMVGEFIDSAALADHLGRGRFVLLGEKHDNPDHHRLQAWLLRALIAAGRRPAVGFEMFTIDDTTAIARQLAAHPTDADGLADAVNWQRSGWPDWAMYQPIAEAALHAKLPIMATNLSQAAARSVSRSGATALDAAFVARLGLDRPLAADTHAALAEEIRAAHCGYASDESVEAMILVQRARDAQMAESLAAAGQQDGAVLIAGAGHVRRDYGIPIYLTSQAPGASVISVAFLEVSQGRLNPPDYAARFRSQTLPFDYVWFTPRVDEDDPCAAFEEQLKKLRKGQ
jgi:uncharacterized iron-regulated protein